MDLNQLVIRSDLSVMLWQLVSFSLAVFITARILPGIQIRSLWSAVLVSITYAFFNFVTYTVFGFFSLTFGFLTLGLGFWFINTVLLIMTDRIVEGFKVRSVFWAAIASLVIVFLDALISRFIQVVIGVRSLRPYLGTLNV